MELNIRIAGSAGQGMQTIGYILSKAFARGGLEVFSVMDYQSRVRGGHNYFQIRVSDKKITAKIDELDILVALDLNTIDSDMNDVKESGVIIYDGEETAADAISCENCVNIPFTSLAVEATKSKLYSNSIAVGAVFGLIDYDMDILYSVLEEFFSKKKGADITKNNIEAVNKGADFAKKLENKPDFERVPSADSEKMLINGNEAIALGALAAGCKFFCSYPMTPSTSIFVNAAKYSHDFDVVVEQAEDEIAAVNMIIGASYAGARSMTTTSGGGYCLMTEGIGFAAIAEIPIVIVNSQRSGPSTGLPTRTEQGDLLFAINASHGDFPHIVLAPSSPKDAFHLTMKAFELADKFQTPVTMLDDQFLADTYVTVKKFDLENVKIDRSIIDTDELNAMEQYNRYEITDSGISPRALPGQSKHVVVSDSDEHTADGHLTEDIEAALLQKDKRSKKLWYIMRDLGLPQTYGSPQAKTVLITWGSSFGVAKELLLKKSNGKLSLINLQEVWPISSEFFMNNLKGKKAITIEGNQTGQMARLIRQVSGIKVDSILKYDGRPFTLDYLEEKLTERGVI
ncbi:2-oxoacid:acceptor oxidoreductase subunit alpha [Thermodesulfobacteriota bacterium]